jgi:hypothetical protein
VSYTNGEALLLVWGKKRAECRQGSEGLLAKYAQAVKALRDSQKLCKELLNAREDLASKLKLGGSNSGASPQIRCSVIPLLLLPRSRVATQ